MSDIDPKIVRHLRDAQPDLYWLDSDPLEPLPHSALVGEVHADLLIVGAGYTGLWSAILAKEQDPNRSVVIVEMRETGAGASGRNGGFCNSSLTHGYQNGKRRFPDEMETIERLGWENLDSIEEAIKKYNIECSWERTGELRVAIAPWQLEGMREEAAERNALGDDVEFLDKEAIQARIHSPIYEGGIFDHDGTALVDPARLVWGLERVCLSLGVQIFENSRVEELVQTKSAVIAHTAYGEVHAQKVALATNVYPALIKKTRKYIVPVYDYQIVTEPLTPAQLESIGWKDREGVSDSGNQFHY
jgi:glycine/D-amino acid oxidase-like deaminating enzyme